MMTKRARAWTSFSEEKGSFENVKGFKSENKGVQNREEKGSPVGAHLPINTHLLNTLLEAPTYLSPNGEGERDIPPPVKKIRKPARGTTPPKAKSSPEGFEEFWSAYPLHKARGSAERAYAKAIAGGATQQDLLLGAMRYAAERDREPDLATRAKFTAHAATWLNRGSWADEPAPASTLPDSFTNNRRAAPSANSREGFGFRVMRLVDE